jgi:hypothetical protein
MAAALDFVYRYAQPSALEGPRLSLATSASPQGYPYFFEGRALHPERLAVQLLVLTQVVRTHFFMPRPVLLDPVFTSNERILRAEGFSGCCGVYVRVDLPSETFDGECKGRGTTNVDFNDPMRRALLGVRRESALNFAVGAHEVAVDTGGERVVEKKVKLPVRWIKSFSEVQAYQTNLQLRFELKAAPALAFLRSFPRVPPKGLSYVVSSGTSLRLSQRPAKGSVPLAGTHRALVLEPLLRDADGLRIWLDEGSGVSAWEVHGRAGRVTLLLSPEVYRGFSGEGQLLQTLGSGAGAELLTRVRAKLNWESGIDAQKVATELSAPPDEVSGALSILGSRGLAGYDALDGRYFHRELPFDLDKVETMQPRLLAARKLVEAGGVAPLGKGEFRVAGTDVHHFVRLLDSGDRCSCPWFSKHQGSRGPCKHVLAAQICSEE